MIKVLVFVKGRWWKDLCGVYMEGRKEKQANIL